MSNPFLSTPSGWRATKRLYCFGVLKAYFYPRPPGGGRPIPPRGRDRRSRFLSTPSGWRATLSVQRSPANGAISIHALRVEGDRGGAGRRRHKPISIHALRVEGDESRPVPGHTLIGFLSTPSGWRATRCAGKGVRAPRFLSTPSGWRATAKTDKVFVCFCAKGRRIYLFKTRKEKICR